MQAQVWKFLRRRSSEFAGALLATMFIAFLIQIVFRFVFSWPVGWAFELQSVCWLWLILWGSSLVLPPSDEIGFDIVYSSVPRVMRRVFRVISSLGLVVIYSISLPAAYEFVAFMKIEKSSYLDIRFDYLFSIYLIFAAASIVRYAWVAWCAFKDIPEPGETGGERLTIE
jgi:TRAP-type C4-dicarboxylate transport system permease small subunit